jgi:hypothetical protein
VKGVPDGFCLAANVSGSKARQKDTAKSLTMIQYGFSGELLYG